MAEKSANPDRRIAVMGGRQHGVVSIRQLLEAGLSHDGVLGRVRNGRLHRVHRGIYAVGHSNLSRKGRWMAAVLVCGEKAVLSHRSAAELWRLLKPTPGPIDVSISSSSGRRKRNGIRIHRRASLAPGSCTSRCGIPVTTPAQTLADLKGRVAPAQYRRAIRQAEVLGLRTGLAASEPTRSELEDLFLRLCKRHGLPKPEVNVWAGGREVDFLWRAEHLVVETDGYKYHRGSQAFENDHDRGLALRDAGLDVLCLTYRQVTDEPDRVADLVARELRRNRIAGPSPPHLPAGRD